jgi:hypothetical protein
VNQYQLVVETNARVDVVVVGVATIAGVVVVVTLRAVEVVNRVLVVGTARAVVVSLVLVVVTPGTRGVVVTTAPVTIVELKNVRFGSSRVGENRG